MIGPSLYKAEPNTGLLGCESSYFPLKRKKNGNKRKQHLVLLGFFSVPSARPVGVCRNFLFPLDSSTTNNLKIKKRRRRKKNLSRNNKIVKKERIICRIFIYRRKIAATHTGINFCVCVYIYLLIVLIHLYEVQLCT